MQRRTNQMDQKYKKAFDIIKNNLSNTPVLVPPHAGCPLLLYLSISDKEFWCVLRQHDDTGINERVAYYLSKKFTSYESRCTLL